MGTSWRINTLEKDTTQITPTSSLIVGASVINAPKGPKEFTFFNKGETQKVLDVFGYPSKEYPSIQDALDSVKATSMWLARPYKEGKFGGIFVTAKGSVPFTEGVAEKHFEDLSKVSSLHSFGKGNNVLTSFEGILTKDSRIDTEALTLTKGETSSKITYGEMGALTDAEGLLTEGSKLDIETGAITLVFNLAPTNLEEVIVKYFVDVSDTKFILYDQDMQKDDLKVRITKSEQVDNALNLNVYRYNPINNDYEELSTSPYLIGLDPTSKDNNGSNIFIENVLSSQKQYMFTPEIIDANITDFVEDKEAVALGGGARGTNPIESDFATLYDNLQDSTTYDIKFAVDPLGYSAIATKFKELRDTYQKYCRFLYCVEDIPASEIIENATEKGVATADRGLYCYCLNWGIHRDVYQGNDFNCSNMGLVASKLVRVLEVGGGVPAWIDEDGVGGILGGAITKLNQRASEPELRQLDSLCFNPIVMDVKYGPMIVGWKTRQVKETVYSFIGQSSLADTLIDLILKNVLPSRIAKLIDDTTYSAVRTGCNTILRAYSQWLEDFYVLCDETNNPPESRNAQKLNVAVGVVFKGYAQMINFNFVTYKNGTKVEEEIKRI